MKSSASSRPSRKPRPRAAPSGRGAWNPLLLLTLLSIAAASITAAAGWTLYYGDANAHLNIARRILDSRQPGWEQIGTVWLPLPHLLALPFVQIDSLWRSGIAGVIPSAACFILSGLFLFLTFERLFQSRAAAWAGLLAYALNPNLLYLQSTPMTEPAAFCALAGLLWATVRFEASRGWADAALAGLFALLGSITRYEAWFPLPFAAAYILLRADAHRWSKTLLFCALAGVGPLYWLAHNQYFYSNALEFYNGPWSARMIYQRALDQGGFRYPGDHDWMQAMRQYREAAFLCLGPPLAWLGAAGLIPALWKRAWWAVLFLLLTPAFYVLSLYSSGTPIFVPTLWPNSHYNTRYGLNALPLAALGVAALASLPSGRLRAWIAALAVAAALSPWLLYPRKDNWVCWKESQVNSAARRAWTQRAAAYLAPRYRRGAGIWMSFGDLTGIVREAGLPLRESFHEGDGLLWTAAAQRPGLFLREEWALAIAGDTVSQTLRHPRRGAPSYLLVSIIAMEGEKPVEIWRRVRK